MRLYLCFVAMAVICLGSTETFAVAPALEKIGGMPPAHQSLIQCDFEGTAVSTGCRVKAHRLKSAQDFETVFLVTYEYPCAGHPIDVVLKSDREAPVVLQRSSTAQVARITGKKFLDIEDTDPRRSYSVYVETTCRLRILRVDGEPSEFTLAFWQEYTALLAESLHDKLTLWKLASSLQRLLSWDDEQLLALKPAIEQSIDVYLREFGSSQHACRDSEGAYLPISELPPAWHRAAAAHPEMIDFVTIAGYIDDIIKNRPDVAVPHDVCEAAERSRKPLAGYFFGELLAKRQEAITFVRRLQEARQQISDDLQRALNEVEKQVNKPGLLFCDMEVCR